MKVRYPSLVRVLVLFLIFCMFMAGFTVSSPKSSVMAQTTPDPGLDEYGGWKGLQGHNTTGHWTVELIGDRYWFITPDNNVLWNLSCIHVGLGDGLYSPKLGYAPMYFGTLAEYGGNKEAWSRATSVDMAALGFNSTLYEHDLDPIIPGMNIMVHLDHSYTQPWNADEMNVPLLKGTSVRGFPDVFDERFQKLWENTCQMRLPAVKDNARVIGISLGGELSWHGGQQGETKAPDMFIAAPKTYVCKQWWVNTFLKERYASVQALNAAYGTTFSSWDDLLDCSSIPDNTKYPAIVADKLDYTEAIADQYYAVVTTAVRKFMPNVLLLSEAWISGNNTAAVMPYNERIWKAAGEHCDVVSIQGYMPLSLQESSLQVVSRYARAAGKPLVVTENGCYAFDTASPVRGGIGMNSMWTQTERAQWYATDIDWIYNFAVTGMNGHSSPIHPIIGTRWYMWSDDPPLGGSAYEGWVGENVNWGVRDPQDESYIPFADVMSTANKQVYAVTTGQHKLIMPEAPAIVAPEASSLTKGRTTFTWKDVPNARSYTLLLSQEAAFPDAQTIRVDGITGTSYTLPSVLANGDWWWAVCAVENTYGYSGLYAEPTRFRVKNDPGTLSAALGLEELNDVTFESIWDSGGYASSHVFLDTAEKSEGTASARCVFMALAWNNTGDIGRKDANVFIDCSDTKDVWTGLTLSVRPGIFCDTNEHYTPASKYLTIRVWDKDGTLFLDQPLDPAGTLPMNQWSTVAVPFGELGARSVAKIALALVSGQENMTSDERLTINVDNIIPMTTADDPSAPPSPVIADLTPSKVTLAVQLDASDPESGIHTAQVSVGSTPGAADLVSWTAVGDDLSLAVPFAAGTTSPWYVNAKVQNGAGVWSAVTTVEGSAWPSSTKADGISEGHGSISPSGTVLIPSGGAQTFSAIPDLGYSVSVLIVDGTVLKSQTTATVQADGKAHTVIAQFVFDDAAWTVDRLPASAKTILSMPIGSRSYQKNGETMTLDVPPYINAAASRTMVPVRAISEGLGADVAWNAEDRVVTLSFDGLNGTHSVQMTIGLMSYTVDGASASMELAPVIVDGRTFVPLTAASTALGAEVTWDAGTRTVHVEAVNAESLVLNTGMTLKEYYAAAGAWDRNNNSIDDAQEQQLMSGAKSVSVCERVMKRTGVFARMDDKDPTTYLPQLSVVLPTAAHGDFIRILYGGRLTGYIHADALPRESRTLPDAVETEKWVTAPGQSLQAFLNNAVATQWLGYLAPGQSLRVSDGAIVGASVGEDPFGFETDTMIDTPNWPFGIRFKLTRVLNNLPSDTLDQKPVASLNEPSVYFIGHRGINGGEWWNGFHDTEISLNGCAARDGASDQNHLLSDLALRSGQLYEIRFVDESCKTAIIALPDGTVLYTVDMSQLSWVKTGGCFPDRRLAVGLWIQAYSSMTVSDLAFVVPPTVP